MQYCIIQGICIKTSVPNTPQENGSIERIWRTSVARSQYLMGNNGVEKIMGFYNHVYFMNVHLY